MSGAGGPPPPRPGKSLGKALDLMRELWALDHALQSRSKAMAATIGLTGPQRVVVRLVGRFPDIAAGSLAELLMIHPSTLTGILQRLESRGMLERHPDPSDGRRIRLRLTPRARELDRETEGTVEMAVKRVLQRIPGGTVDSARELIDALTRELHAMAGPAAGGAPPARRRRGRPA
ncbi:MAG TPA: MarR family transcriptional regulator [Myxococcales bacterium]|nr:MarR family transcriptional regulator [Myxococcales bacterium]